MRALASVASPPYLCYHKPMTDNRRMLEREEPPLPGLEAHTGDIPHALLRGIMEVEDVTTGGTQGRTVRVRGRFRVDPSEAYERLAPWFRARGHTVLLRREGILRAVGEGWGFVASLLAILVSHEFGHYFMARRFGVAVSLPYLIPMPISPFGTMGAVIRMKDIPPNRRAMLLIGAAGPLAGLAVAIPVLLYGLSLSQVTPLPASGYSMEGNSLLYAGLKYLIFGRLLPSGGEDVFLHPVAFAGWAGLLVTSFNLIPAGQLDGGHVAYALLGQRTRYLNWAILGVLLVMGLFWQGWFLWAFLVFIFSRARVSPMDDVSPLTPVGIAVAVSLLVLFVLTFTPVPLRIVM